MTIDSADDSQNFESDHRYESNLESDVRFEIESNHEASQVPKFLFKSTHHTWRYDRKCEWVFFDTVYIQILQIVFAAYWYEKGKKVKVEHLI